MESRMNYVKRFRSTEYSTFLEKVRENDNDLEEYSKSLNDNEVKRI